ncbi:MAG TPA: hypothetical protein VNB22_14795 [Pyrinomonadaceae bacterium]|nr:hypothetical protein [Pyrinomonadaceae bacterium]
MNTSLENHYQELRREATVLAGEPKDIPQRAAMLHEIYLDSHGNHGFAEIATHGALWGFRFFETTGTLGNLISYRYFYNKNEMKYRHGLLQTFADGFKTANRSVFIDTYSNYYFTKEFGAEKEAETILKPELLDALRQITKAAKAQELLDTNVRRKLFQTTLQWEQETTVAPKVKEEIAKFDCPILRRLVLKPFVRFSYFPRFKLFWFKNFSDTDERIRNAHECFEIAEKVGWARVFASLEKYEVLEKDFFGQPLDFARNLKEKLLLQAA